jgi:hypothetical protein
MWYKLKIGYLFLRPNTGIESTIRRTVPLVMEPMRLCAYIREQFNDIDQGNLRVSIGLLCTDYKCQRTPSKRLDNRTICQKILALYCSYSDF